uniref:Argonaute1 (AGO1) putative n=1 Tax=Albugo laibachii Nc14 TaxID=890382 RepID=F0WRM1_9STRA|nr:Argonaute1 (AGO1) putative [Albugo laibachii Nc14]|eukprot:CCA23985.1 Argonaute1 (AGO1) putative [Albugo laibachii Nc14]
MDQDCIRYAATLRVQGHRVEQIVNCKKWRTNFLYFSIKNQESSPGASCSYRDGFSEGEFEMVLTHEVIAIRAACASLEKDYMPAITFVVVQKRHNTRLFAVDQKDTDRRGMSKLAQL